MLNVNLTYKPPISWRILFRSWGYPMQFSCLKFFRALVVPGRDRCKRIILQEIMTPIGVLPNVQSCLRRKWYLTGDSTHAPIHRNSTYAQTVGRSNLRYQKTRTPSLENPLIRTTPPGTPLTAPLQVLFHHGAQARRTLVYVTYCT